MSVYYFLTSYLSDREGFVGKSIEDLTEAIIKSDVKDLKSAEYRDMYLSDKAYVFSINKLGTFVIFPLSEDIYERSNIVITGLKQFLDSSIIQMSTQIEEAWMKWFNQETAKLFKEIVELDLFDQEPPFVDFVARHSEIYINKERFDRVVYAYFAGEELDPMFNSTPNGSAHIRYTTTYKSLKFERGFQISQLFCEKEYLHVIDTAKEIGFTLYPKQD